VRSMESRRLLSAVPVCARMSLSITETV
jgi:hypothetical protein